MPIPIAGAFGGGSASLTGNNVWIVDSSQVSGAYATSGISYVPLNAGNSDHIEFGFTAGKSGTITITLIYAMTASEASNSVDLTVQTYGIAVGEDPDGSPPAGSAASVTPGSGTTVKKTEIEVTGIEVDDIGFIKLTRSNSDSHTGDMRILGIKA